MNKQLPLFGALVLASSSVLAHQQWQGYYIGASAGFGFNPGDNGELEFRRVDGSDNGQAIENAFGDNFEGKFNAGSLVGLQAGYDFQNGRYVYGVELSVSAADLSQEQNAFSATPATYIERREVDVLTTLTGRLGFASEHAFLPYIKAGLAYGDVDYSWEGNSGAFRGEADDDDGSGLGYTVGIGMEVRLEKNLTLSFEYQYVDLGDADFATNFSGEQSIGGSNGAFNAFGNAASGGTNAEGSDDDFDFQVVHTQLKYRF